MEDFVLTQTDAQVQSVLNDAQDAKGAGAQTTLTTEYVMLKDTNGRYHKILKSSLTEACRNVLASLLVNNDKGTTISQIAAIASGDFGSVTPANLASVLGGSLYFANTEGEFKDSDFDNAPLGFVISGQLGSNANAPANVDNYSVGSCLTLAYASGKRKVQIIFAAYATTSFPASISIRNMTGSGWTTWKYISLSE